MLYTLTWERPITPAQAVEIGRRQLDRIRRRCAIGLSAEGAPFAAYSDDYAKKKGGPVNLTATGEMLDSLEVFEANETSVTIGIRGEPAIRGEAHQEGTTTLPARPWLGATDDELGAIEADALRFAILNQLQKEGR